MQPRGQLWPGSRCSPSGHHCLSPGEPRVCQLVPGSCLPSLLETGARAPLCGASEGGASARRPDSLLGPSGRALCAASIVREQAGLLAKFGFPLLEAHSLGLRNILGCEISALANKTGNSWKPWRVPYAAVSLLSGPSA